MRIGINRVPNNNAMKPSARATFLDWYNGKLEAVFKIFEVWQYDNIERYHPTSNPDGVWTMKDYGLDYYPQCT
uniref:Uncharacterized protein n=1 Tax=Romanomermis culicivorax TaxID=13658 RepID=A0A915KFI2_ROMCU